MHSVSEVAFSPESNFQNDVEQAESRRANQSNECVQEEFAGYSEGEERIEELIQIFLRTAA